MRALLQEPVGRFVAAPFSWSKRSYSRKLQKKLLLATSTDTVEPSEPLRVFIEVMVWVPKEKAKFSSIAITFYGSDIRALERSEWDSDTSSSRFHIAINDFCCLQRQIERKWVLEKLASTHINNCQSFQWDYSNYRHKSFWCSLNAIVQSR